MDRFGFKSCLCFCRGLGTTVLSCRKWGLPLRFDDIWTHGKHSKNSSHLALLFLLSQVTLYGRQETVNMTFDYAFNELFRPSLSSSPVPPSLSPFRPLLPPILFTIRHASVPLATVLSNEPYIPAFLMPPHSETGQSELTRCSLMSLCSDLLHLLHNKPLPVCPGFYSPDQRAKISVPREGDPTDEMAAPN